MEGNLIFPIKIKNKHIVWLVNFTSRNQPREIIVKGHEDGVHVFTVALLPIANNKNKKGIYLMFIIEA